jgi:Glycosyl transferase 4-like domain
MATPGPALAFGGGVTTRAALSTVVSVPAGHPYVARIAASPYVTVLPDPPVKGAPAGVWWPPVSLNPAWIREHRHDADLLHIHFGTESFSPEHLRSTIDTAHDVGWPVVVTVHDLEHPQLGDQDAYRAQLEVLVRGADAVITLTTGAAAEISARWGRDAVVIPHPALLYDGAPVRRVRGFEEVRVGVHLKDLRPNVAGPRTVKALVAAVAALRRDGVPVVGEVRLHHRVRDEAARDRVRQLCSATDAVVLIEHERLSDAELAVALSRLDVCVLPYRHGTHSGWLELCWDLGVPVACPAVGHYAEQHTDGSVGTYTPEDDASLTATVATLLRSDSAARAGSERRAELIEARRAVRATIDDVSAETHAGLYRQLIRERRS